MRRDEALFSRKFSSHLAEQDVTAVDFQRETLKVVDAHDRFMRNWRHLVNGLIVKNGRLESISRDRKNHPFLIIPIDDADLNPAALPVIMQQIQFLQHPNVLFLFSMNMRSLNSMMYISQLEMNTNRTEARPVVNFNTLIRHGLREVEDVRSDAKNKVNKYLPHKYRVKIQPLSPKQRLDFKPLVNNEEDPTFLQLLKKIPMDAFRNKLRDISQFFDLAQSCNRCQSGGDPEFGEVCRECPSNGENKGMTDENKTEQTLGHLSSPIPSAYADALPKSPRAMDQLYHILLRWVLDIDGVLENIKGLGCDLSVKREIIWKNLKNDDRKKLDRFEKEEREKVSRSVQEFLTICSDNIKLLPSSFRRRIKFIENPNPLSKHPILIEFDTRHLELDIEVSGIGIKINTTTKKQSSSHILSVHPITNYRMDIKGAVSDRIPSTWEICGKKRPKTTETKTETEILTISATGEEERSKEERSTAKVRTEEEILYHRVPQEYFAVYNLAYDLTSSVGVFDRAIQSSDYQMRDASANTAIGILSIQTEERVPFTDCFCAMPRWYRVAHYNLFAFAWNDLVRHVGDIVIGLAPGKMLSNHVLSDWVVLSLLRIHICIAMNYAPFIVTDVERERIRERIEYDAGKLWTPEDPLSKIKEFVKKGLSSVMKQIGKDSQGRVLLKHQRAFRTWVEYGLPLLSNGEYVSKSLGDWIRTTWAGLFDSDGMRRRVLERFDKMPKPSEWAGFDIKQRNAFFFLQEFGKLPGEEREVFIKQLKDALMKK